MVSVDWEQVTDDDYRVPDGPPLADLTADLTTRLGEHDAERRRAARAVLTTWISRGVYDDLLTGLGDGMTAGLTVGLGRFSSDSVFRRGSSALVLAACIDRDTSRPLVTGARVLEWGDRLCGWLLDERDLRGPVPGKGRADAVAHGADALGALGNSPHVGVGELAVVLDVLAERATTPSGQVLGAGDADRLAMASLEVLRRNRLALEALEPWLERLTEAGRPDPTAAVEPDDEAHQVAAQIAANTQAFLRALYLQLAFAPRPPEVRADLLLMLVETLKTTNRRTLGLTQ